MDRFNLKRQIYFKKQHWTKVVQDTAKYFQLIFIFLQHLENDTDIENIKT